MLLTWALDCILSGHACIHAPFVYACFLSPVVACVFFLPRTVRNGSCAASVSSRAIFKPCSLQHALSPLCPTSRNVSAAVWAPRSASTVCFPSPYAVALVEPNLLLAETSATIRISPIGWVMLLKGFACILVAGSGNTLGCHLCRPGMRQNGWGRHKAPLHPFPVVAHWADSLEPGWPFVCPKWISYKIWC